MAEHFLDWLMRERGLIQIEAPKPTPATPGAYAAPSDHDDQLAAYVRNAVNREWDSVANCPEGGRNHALNRAAFNLGSLVTGGYIPEQQTIDMLSDAGRRCGLPQHEIDSTLIRSLRDGGKTPRRILLTPRPDIPDTYVLDDNDPPADPPNSDTGNEDDDQDEFWDSSPELWHIRAFARARMVPKWAMLGECLLRVAATVPPNVTLPPIIGGRASLNTFIALVAQSGGGKGTSAAAARDAFKYDDFPIFETGVGSGEGITKQYMTWDAKAKAWLPLRDSVLASMPEVDRLTALGARDASTLMPVLRSAWSGESLTPGYADPTKNPPITAHSYRLCLSVGVQYGRGEALLKDADGGTPQRFLWMPLKDRTLPHPDEPQAAEPTRMNIAGRLRFGSGEINLPIPDHVARTLRIAQWEKITSGSTETSLDGHLPLCRLKTAAVLALLEGRRGVETHDWDRAGVIVEVSNRTRESITRHLKREADRTRDAIATNKAQEAIKVASAVDAEATRKAAQWMCGKVEKAGEISWRDISRAAKTTYRSHLSDALERLVDGGFVKVVDVPNESRNGSVTRMVRWSK